MKKTRKVVRTFLIKNNHVVVIKYKTNQNLNYYDIPGGKIEDGETSKQASIREFKEETGIQIIEQEYKGNVIIEEPEIIYNIDVYVVYKYNGEPEDFEENYSMWIDINELLNEDKKIPSIEILKYLNLENIDIKIFTDKTHNILEIEI